MHSVNNYDAYFRSLHMNCKEKSHEYYTNNNFYFSVPFEVVNLQVNISSKQLLVSWDPPISANGVIIGYNITVLDPLQSRNFSVTGDQNYLFITIGKLNTERSSTQMSTHAAFYIYILSDR